MGKSGDREEDIIYSKPEDELFDQVPMVFYLRSFCASNMAPDFFSKLIFSWAPGPSVSRYTLSRWQLMRLVILLAEFNDSCHWFFAYWLLHGVLFTLLCIISSCTFRSYSVCFHVLAYFLIWLFKDVRAASYFKWLDKFMNIKQFSW